MAKRVAVILSGCGVYDGTEVHEASAVLVHLSRAGAKVQMFAPDVEMMHVVNHCEGKPGTDKRNVLQESARIARGDVTDLVKLDVGAFDALIIPEAVRHPSAHRQPHHYKELLTIIIVTSSQSKHLHRKVKHKHFVSAGRGRSHVFVVLLHSTLAEILQRQRRKHRENTV